MKEKILLFIPTYNCEKQIARVLRQVDDEVLDYITEVIVINNRSQDKTEDEVIRFAEENTQVPVKLLRNRDNYSLGGSHKVAFQYAKDNGFDYVIVLHGDDQGDIHDLLFWIKKGKHRKYKSLLGSRFEKKSTLVNYSRFRIIGNYVFNIFISTMAGKRLTDLGSGLNMYQTEYLKSGFYMTFPNNLTFNVYMLLYGLYSKSQFHFFPLCWREEDQVSNAKLWKQSTQILQLTMQYVFTKDKLFGVQKNEFSEIEYTYDVIHENRGVKENE
ncbi:MAG: glycosyltransferase family 2 protein [Lachnospiraceae bacterium]|nr:glycosyltransferase family 2 protein [Lachnospiraceae bacterium]